MTNMTVNGVSTTKTPGTEQYEIVKWNLGRQQKKFYSYDYRHTDGELFSCTKDTLKECRKARDAWLEKKNAQPA